MTKFLVLVGASGSGKTVLGNLLAKEYPNVFNLTTQITTREMREDETQTCPYFFVNEEYFAALKDECIGLVSSDSPYGSNYGTLKEFIVDDKINIILLCQEGLNNFRKRINQDDEYVVIGLDLITDKSIRPDRDLNFLAWESRVLIESHLNYKTIPAIKDYVTTEKVMSDLLCSTKLFDGISIAQDVKSVINKFYDKEVEYKVKCLHNVDDDVRELMESNRYKIDVLLYSYLYNSGIKIKNSTEFAFRNKLYPTFVRNFDIIADDLCDHNVSRFADVILDKRIMDIETDNKHVKTYLELNKHIDDTVYKHSRDMIGYGNLKKEATNIIDFIKYSVLEGEAVGKAQLEFIKPFVSFKNDKEWDKFYNGYVLMGLFNHIEDDSEDFIDDYKNGEIKLIPNSEKEEYLKRTASLYRQKFNQEYPEFYEIYRVWKRMRHLYTFKLDFIDAPTMKESKFV